MKRPPLIPAPAVDLAHERASLIAQLALHSAWPADAIEYFRRLLAKHSPTDILAALDWVLAELVAEGHAPAFPADEAADSVLLLDQGLRRLQRLTPAPTSYPPLLAAA
jgi:hypothetical protein